MIGQGLDHPARLLFPPAEGNHDAQIGQAHGLAHPHQSRALQREAGGVGGVGVARRAPEAEHRIGLLGFEAGAADQPGVFVGLEVRQAHDHRPGIEGRGDGPDAL